MRFNRAIIFNLFVFVVSTTMGQVRIANSSVNPAAASSSSFIDASSNLSNNSTTNIGKGLLFPRTNLTTFTAFSGSPFVANSYPTRYDGMIVYNTGTGVAGIGTAIVTPGFYYYSNQSTTDTNGGQWVRMANEFDLKTTPSGSDFPTSPAPSLGDVFYNTTANSLYYYNGTDWVGVLSTPSGTTLPDVANSKSGDLFYDTSLGANSSVLKIFNAATNTWDPVVADGSITDVKLQASGGGALAGGTAGQVLTSAGNNQFKWTSAGVSSVGLSLDLYSTPTAVTSAGTLSATLLSQPAGTVLSAPASAAGTPSFRKLGVSDLSPFTTDDVPQGTTNKYYTSTTVLADLSSDLAAKQDVANMTNTIAADGTNKLYPSVNGVISYVGTALVDVNNKITQNTTDISKKLDANSAITASSNYSIVNYDSKGLVTSGKVPTTDDISDAASATYKYVTPAQLTILGNTTGTNSGDQTLSVGGGKLKISGTAGNNVDVVTSLIAGSGLTGTGTTGDITLSLGTNAVGATALKGSGGIALTAGGGSGFVLQSNGDGTFSWKDISSGVSADPSTLSLPEGYLFVGNSSGKAEAATKSSVHINEFGAATADVSMGTYSIKNLPTTPTDANDAASKAYVDTKVSTSLVGATSGVAPLGTDGKIASQYLPSALVGAVNYVGTWDFTSTLPTAATDNKGNYYVASVAGTASGNTYAIGDWIISDGTTWGKVSNNNGVTTIFGRSGVVLAQDNDYNTAQVKETTNLYYTETRVTNNPTVVALGNNKEDKSNKVSTIVAESTNTTYPSAQAVINYVTTKVPSTTSVADGNVLTVVSGVPTWQAVAGDGTVKSVSVTTNAGISGTVTDASINPAIKLTLGDITPSSVATGAVSATTVTATGAVIGSNIPSGTVVSGTNTGDQGITITGTDIAGTPNSTTKTTSIALSINDNAITTAKIKDGTVSNADLATQSVAATNLKNITVTGSSGQVLTSDGTGGFAWGSSTGITSVSAINGLSATTTSGAVTVGISDAGIAYSKLATLPSGTLLGYSATGNAALTSAQAKTLLGLSNVEDTKLSTWPGTSNITTVGTITAGTWNGGTIDIAHGGTGKTIRTDAINALLPDQTNNSGKVLQTDGTDVSWISTATGTVTSVGLSLPSIFTVSSSPVTGSGILTANLTPQKTAYVLAGPATGTTDVAPTFRALVATDIPTLNQNTTGTASTVTTAAQPAITSVGTLTSLTVSGTITGTLSGNATSATNVGITDASPALTVYPTWVTANTGTLPLKVSSANFSFIPSTGVLTATSFAGYINATNLNTGTIPALRYGTNTIPVASIAAGTPSASTYLRGDGSWATPTAGTGTITSVTPVSTDGLTVNGSTSVAATSGAVTLGISTASVDLTKLKTIAAGTLLGNNTAGVSSPLALTAAQAKTLLTLTKADVGLANVQNLDQTNASNITSGTLAGTLFGSMTIPLTAIAATGTPSSTTYLRGDGTWSAASGGGSGTDPTLTYTSLSTSGQMQAGAGGAATIPLVTSSAGTNLAGLMAPIDKKKLDDMASVTNSPTAGYVLTALTSTTASWQAPAITYTAAAANGSLAITGGNTVTLPAVTPTAGTNLAGLMIPADKTKLDNLPTITNAPVTTADQVLTSNADGTATWKVATGGGSGGTLMVYSAGDVTSSSGTTNFYCRATATGVTATLGADNHHFIVTVPSGVFLDYLKVKTSRAILGAQDNLNVLIVYADKLINNTVLDEVIPFITITDYNTVQSGTTILQTIQGPASTNFICKIDALGDGQIEFFTSSLSMHASSNGFFISFHF